MTTVAIDFRVDSKQAIANTKALQQQIVQLNNYVNSTQLGRSLGNDKFLNTKLATQTAAMDDLTKKIKSGTISQKEFAESIRNTNDLVNYQARLYGATMTEFDKMSNGMYRSILDVDGAMQRQITTAEKYGLRLQAIGKSYEAIGRQRIQAGRELSFAAFQTLFTTTLPVALAAGGTAAAQYSIDKQLTDIVKVYDEAAGEIEQTTSQIRESMMQMAVDVNNSLAISAKDTLELAKGFAALGETGENLENMTNEAARLMRLGDVEQDSAQKLITTLRSVMEFEGQQLSDAINLMNQMENSSTLAMQDFADAGPKILPIIRAWGGTFEEAAQALEAYTRAGIPAVEGANAMKSAFSFLTSADGPLKQSYKNLFGSEADIKKDFNAVQGNVTAFLTQVGEEIDAMGLDELNPKVREFFVELFGSHQVSRNLSLARNLATASSQVQSALTATSDELAAVADSEIADLMASQSAQFDKWFNSLIMGFARIGETTLPVINKFMAILAGLTNGIANVLDNTPAFIKNFTIFGLIMAAAVSPVLFIVAGLKQLRGGIDLVRGKLTSAIGISRKFANGLTLITAEERALMMAQEAANSKMTAQINQMNALRGSSDAAAISLRRLGAANTAVNNSFVQRWNNIPKVDSRLLPVEYGRDAMILQQQQAVAHQRSVLRNTEKQFASRDYTSPHERSMLMRQYSNQKETLAMMVDQTTAMKRLNEKIVLVAADPKPALRNKEAIAKFERAQKDANRILTNYTKNKAPRNLPMLARSKDALARARAEMQAARRLDSELNRARVAAERKEELRQRRENLRASVLTSNSHGMPVLIGQARGLNSELNKGATNTGKMAQNVDRMSAALVTTRDRLNRIAKDGRAYQSGTAAGGAVGTAAMLGSFITDDDKMQNILLGIAIAAPLAGGAIAKLSVKVAALVTNLGKVALQTKAIKSISTSSALGAGIFSGAGAVAAGPDRLSNQEKRRRQNEIFNSTSSSTRRGIKVGMMDGLAAARANFSRDFMSMIRSPLVKVLGVLGLVTAAIEVYKNWRDKIEQDSMAMWSAQNDSVSQHASLLGYTEKAYESYNFAIEETKESVIELANAYAENDTMANGLIKRMDQVKDSASALKAILEMEGYKILASGGTQEDVNRMASAALMAAGVSESITREVVLELDDLSVKTLVDDVNSELNRELDRVFSEDSMMRSKFDQFIDQIYTAPVTGFDFTPTFDESNQEQVQAYIAQLRNMIEVTDDPEIKQELGDKIASLMASSVEMAEPSFSEKFGNMFGSSITSLFNPGVFVKEFSGSILEELDAMSIGSKIADSLLPNYVPSISDWWDRRNGNDVYKASDEIVDAQVRMLNALKEVDKEAGLFLQDGGIAKGYEKIVSDMRTVTNLLNAKSTGGFMDRKEAEIAYEQALGRIERQTGRLNEAEKIRLKNIYLMSAGLQTIEEFDPNVKDLNDMEKAMLQGRLNAADFSTQLRNVKENAASAGDEIDDAAEEMEDKTADWTIQIRLDDGALATLDFETIKQMWTNVQSDMFAEASRLYDEYNQEILEGIAKESEERQKALDEEEARLGDIWDAKEKALDKQHDAEVEAFDDGWDKRIEAEEKALDDRIEAEKAVFDQKIKAIEDEQEAEDELDKQKQRAFEREKARMQYLYSMMQSNIDYQMALAGGNLDDAARISVNNQQATYDYLSSSQEREDSYAKEDRDAERDKRIESLESQRDDRVSQLESQKDIRLKALDEQREAERKAMDERIELERESLAEQRRLQEQWLADRREALREEYKMKEENTRNELDAKKRQIEEELRTLQAFIPRNEEEYLAHVKRLEDFYSRHSDVLEIKGDEWATAIKNILNNRMNESVAQMSNDGRWEEFGRRSADAVARGGFEMSASQLMDFLRTGNLPAMGPRNQGQDTSKGGSGFAGGSGSGRVGVGGGGGTVGVRHKGGPIGGAMYKRQDPHSSRGGRPMSSPMARDERVILAQDGEFMIQKRAVQKYGTDFFATINNGEFMPPVEPGMGGSGFGTMMGAFMAAASQRLVGSITEAIGTAAQTSALSGSGDLKGISIPQAAGNYAGYNLNDTQLKTAALIAQSFQEESADRNDLIIGLMVAGVESAMGTAGMYKEVDHDSLGAFQQRAAWGPKADRIDIKKSAKMFLHGGQQGQRGLFDFPQRKSWERWYTAAEVQQPAYQYRTRYKDWEPTAMALVGAGIGEGVSRNQIKNNLKYGGWTTEGIKKWEADKAYSGIYSGDIVALPGEYGHPLAGKGVFTSGFGPRWGAHHDGVDIGAPVGTPIYATKAGNVTFASTWDDGGFGFHTVIDHGGGITSGYAHQSRVGVRPGQSVVKGQRIGDVGNTGQSTGPHLHFQLGRGSNGGKYNYTTDPRAFGIPGLGVGGIIKYDDTIANLHKDEAVLTKPLTQDLKDGVQRLSRDDNRSSEFNFSFNQSGGIFGVDALNEMLEDFARDIMRKMEEATLMKQRRLG